MYIVKSASTTLLIRYSLMVFTVTRFSGRRFVRKMEIKTI